MPSASGLASFLPVPVDGAKLSYHGIALLRIVSIMKTAFSCHGTLSRWSAKNAANRALACSPIDSPGRRRAGEALEINKLVEGFNDGEKIKKKRERSGP